MLSHGGDSSPLHAGPAPRHRAGDEDAGRRVIADRVFQTSVDGILAFDRHLHVTAWNPSMETLFGLPAAEVVGRSVFAVLPCLLANGEAPLYRATLEGDAPVSRARPFSVEQTGCSGLVDCHYSPLQEDDGSTSGGLVVFRDRTRSSEVALALRDAREQFTELFENAPTGMALIEFDAARIGTFTRVNEALCRITGRTASELTACAVAELMDPADAAREAALVGRLLAGAISRYSVQRRLRRPDGSTTLTTARVSLLRAGGGARHGVMQVEVAGAGGRPEELHLVDGAGPGVLDRVGFAAAVRRQIADAERFGHPGAVVILRLDGLADIDRTLGRPAGEEAIERALELLTARMRETDVVAMLDPGEFGVLLRHVDARTAEAVAHELATHLSTGVVVRSGGRQLAVNGRAGVAAVDAGSGGAETVLMRARSAAPEPRLRARRMRGPHDVPPSARAV
jgi:PAS domain S-box-containing protein/diguanylate cyclase (GGDEF)-like protein